jgi:RHS repeat-associated protein
VTLTAEHAYGGDLRRVEKSNGKLYWYSGGQVLEETDLSGNLLNDYVYLAGQRVARRDSSGSVFYYYTDPVVGSTLAIYQSSGSLCYQGVYYPFGGEKVYTNTCAQNYKFTGLERDAESGLDETLNRMYSSNLGRWLEADPVRSRGGNPQLENRYAYVANSPTNRTDRRGDQCCDDSGYCCDPFSDPWCDCGCDESPPSVSVSVSHDEAIRNYHLAGFVAIPIPGLAEITGLCQYTACDQRPAEETQSSCNTLFVSSLSLLLHYGRLTCPKGIKSADVIAVSVSITLTDIPFVDDHSFSVGACFIFSLSKPEYVDYDPCPLAVFF